MTRNYQNAKGLRGHCTGQGEGDARERRERPGALLARRTRGLGRPSFDARSRGQPWPPPSDTGERDKGREKEYSLAIPRARGTRALRRASFDARSQGPSGHPLQRELGREKEKEKKRSLPIPCARATRGL